MYLAAPSAHLTAHTQRVVHLGLKRLQTFPLTTPDTLYLRTAELNILRSALLLLRTVLMG